MRNKTITQIIREQESMLRKLERDYVNIAYSGDGFFNILRQNPTDRTTPLGQKNFIKMLRKQRADEIKKAKNRMRRKMCNTTQQKQRTNNNTGITS